MPIAWTVLLLLLGGCSPMQDRVEMQDRVDQQAAQPRPAAAVKQTRAQAPAPPWLVGEVLCVVGIDAPDQMHIRSGPGADFAERGVLRADACTLRSGGRAIGDWQPLTLMVGVGIELVVVEGWVQSGYVRKATEVDTPEAIAALHREGAVFSVAADGSDPLQVAPCSAGGPDSYACVMSLWHWQESPHPCTPRMVSHWKRSGSIDLEIERDSSDVWMAEPRLELVFDC